MYFPGDPLFALDPIYQSVVDPAARERLVATYDHDLTQPEWCTGLPLGHRAHRPAPHPAWRRATSDARRPPCRPTPGQTVGPFFGYALPFADDNELVPPGHARARSAARPGATTAPASRCPTRSSSSGRPTPTATSSSEPGSLRRDGSTFTGWGRASTDAEGHYPFTTRRPGRRRSSRSRSSRAACSTGSSPAPTCPTRPSDAFLATARRGPPLDAARPRRTRRAVRVRVRRPAAGRAGDRLPHLPATLSADDRPASGPATHRAGDHFTQRAFLAGDGRGRGRRLEPGAAGRPTLPSRLSGVEPATRAATRRRPAATRSSRWSGAAPRRGRAAGRSAAAPRADQPGRARHRADAAWLQDAVDAAAVRRSAARPSALAALAGRAPRHRDGRPDPDPARASRPRSGSRSRTWLTGVLDAYDDLGR